MTEEKRVYAPFYTPDKELHSLDDLKKYLQDIDENIYSQYVNPGKNDFSNWLEYIGEKDIADKLRKCRTKTQALEMISRTSINNLLVSGNINDKVRWYIRAHGHSSIGGLNIIHTYFEFHKQLMEAATVERAIKQFENFSVGDMDKNLISLKTAIESVKKIVTVSVAGNAKNEMQGILEEINLNIVRIQNIMKNPGYEERLRPSKILFNAIVQLTKQYPTILYGDQVGKKGISGDRILLTVDEPDEDKETLFCGYVLQLLFFNLLCNAVEAIKEKDDCGNIHVKLYYENGFCGEITDNGKLMTDEMMEKILTHKEFSTRGKEHGHGIKIVFDILDKYGGTLDIRKDQAAGTMTFSFRLPMRQ
ncbi:MAG: ATP-binding protein [archaeon]